VSTLPSTDKKTKQPASVYTVMLFLSMLFMLLAVIAMFIEFRRYGPQLYNTQEAQPSVMVMPADNVRII
jgi:hypothetical protein